MHNSRYIDCLFSLFHDSCPPPLPIRRHVHMADYGTKNAAIITAADHAPAPVAWKIAADGIATNQASD